MAADMGQKMLKIGDKVDLFLGEGPTYRTMLEDITEEGLLVVSAPIYRGIPIVLHKKQTMELYFYRQTGRYCIDAEAVGHDLSGQVKLIMLMVLSAPRKQQRRESFRCDTTLQAIVRHSTVGPFLENVFMDDEEEQELVSTENISETGVSLLTKAQYKVGEKLYVRIALNPQNEDGVPMDIFCVVRRVSVVDSVRGTYSIGMQFLDASEEMRGTIAKYVLIEQQRQIKAKRLAEEE